MEPSDPLSRRRSLLCFQDAMHMLEDFHVPRWERADEDSETVQRIFVGGGMMSATTVGQVVATTATTTKTKHHHSTTTKTNGGGMILVKTRACITQVSRRTPDSRSAPDARNVLKFTCKTCGRLLRVARPSAAHDTCLRLRCAHPLASSCNRSSDLPAR
jgi:hypothetical protein